MVCKIVGNKFYANNRYFSATSLHCCQPSRLQLTLTALYSSRDRLTENNGAKNVFFSNSRLFPKKQELVWYQHGARMHDLLRVTSHFMVLLGNWESFKKMVHLHYSPWCDAPMSIMFLSWTYLAWPHWKNHVLLTGANTRIMCFDDTSWYIGEDNNTAPKVLETDVGDVEAATVFWPRRQIVDSGSAKTSIPTVEDEWLTSVVFNSSMTWNSKESWKFLWNCYISTVVVKIQ